MVSRLSGKEILITGGTGSLGRTLVKVLIKDGHAPRGIRVFSRDEQKHFVMFYEMEEFQSKCGTHVPIAYTVGDVRDFSRLMQAMENVHIVIHTAAMKHIPVCENNPLEAVLTNIVGSSNVIRACLDRNVEKVMFISTDKAVHPINLYGYTKGAAEKLFIHANVYRGGHKQTRFSICRYGNVLASKGSVVPTFLKLVSEGKPLPITHRHMTRFWITLPNVARFLLDRVQEMQGKETFIPRMNALKLVDIARYIGGDEYPLEEVGIRPGEKLHECLIAPEESYTEMQCFKEMGKYSFYLVGNGKSGAGLYSYSQENHWLSKEEFDAMLREEV